MSSEPLKPLPPVLSSSQIQVENVSPAPVSQQHIPVTAEVTQSVNTTLVSAQAAIQPTEKLTTTSDVSQSTLPSFSTVTSSYSTEPNYSMQFYQQTVQPQGVATLTTNASFQASVGTSHGSMQSFQLPAQFQNQTFLPQTQTYPHFPQSQSSAQHPLPPVGFPGPPTCLPPVPSNSLFHPPSAISTLPSPAGFGMPSQGRPPHPPITLPPPPLPPLHSGQLPPLRQVTSTDFQWPRQFGVPPSQNQQMGGWMR